MSDNLAVPFGAAVAVVLALLVMLVDWERIRWVLCRSRRVEIEGGFRDVFLFTVIAFGIVDLVLSFFLGEFVLGRWVWGLT